MERTKLGESVVPCNAAAVAEAILGLARGRTLPCRSDLHWALEIDVHERGLALSLVRLAGASPWIGDEEFCVSDGLSPRLLIDVGMHGEVAEGATALREACSVHMRVNAARWAEIALDWAVPIMRREFDLLIEEAGNPHTDINMVLSRSLEVVGLLNGRSSGFEQAGLDRCLRAQDDSLCWHRGGDEAARAICVTAGGYTMTEGIEERRDRDYVGEAVTAAVDAIRSRGQDGRPAAVWGAVFETLDIADGEGIRSGSAVAEAFGYSSTGEGDDLLPLVMADVARLAEERIADTAKVVRARLGEEIRSGGLVGLYGVELDAADGLVELSGVRDLDGGVYRWLVSVDAETLRVTDGDVLVEASIGGPWTPIAEAGLDEPESVAADCALARRAVEGVVGQALGEEPGRSVAGGIGMLASEAAALDQVVSSWERVAWRRGTVRSIGVEDGRVVAQVAAAGQPAVKVVDDGRNIRCYGGSHEAIVASVEAFAVRGGKTLRINTDDPDKLRISAYECIMKGVRPLPELDDWTQGLLYDLRKAELKSGMHAEEVGPARAADFIRGHLGVLGYGEHEIEVGLKLTFRGAIPDSPDAGGLEAEDLDGPGTFDCDDHDLTDFPGGVPPGVFDCDGHDAAKPSGRASSVGRR